jgi:hypothetical protein
MEPNLKYLNFVVDVKKWTLGKAGYGKQGQKLLPNRRPFTPAA